MRRFRFRLERLLAIRRYVEREWELELARATSAVLATRAGIASAEEGIARSYGSAGTGGPGALLDGGAVAVAETYRAGMAARIRMLSLELARQEAELETVREGYLEASRSRKVLDKLKERQGDAARKSQNREEIAVLNDIATSRASRWE
jgi:flagellar protein FliJ